MLDKTDYHLLDLLQRDCTLSLQALAAAVNLTTTPCWKRLKKLEDDGIIRACVALLDAARPVAHRFYTGGKPSSTAANGISASSLRCRTCRKC